MSRHRLQRGGRWAIQNRWRRLPALLFALALSLYVGVAPAAEPGAELTISLLTMGPGEHPFTKFGHSAIWIHDARANRDEVFNFGTFAFDSPSLLLDSVRGVLPYWLAMQSLRGTLASYREQRRSLLASELELTPAQRTSLLAQLRTNALPQNRYYRYDYYRDNCATRVRDALDRVLEGRLREHVNEPASMSYRAHTRRLVAGNPVLYTAIDLAIGRGTDSSVTFWDEAWLPTRLHDLFARTTVRQGAVELPLIRSEHVLLPTVLPEPRSLSADFCARYLGAGIAFGLGFLGLGAAAAQNRRARAALLALLVVLFVPLGLLGGALVYLTFFSGHGAAAANFNVLLLPPWLCCVPALALAEWRGKAWAKRGALLLTTSALACSLLALLFHCCRSSQDNAQELAFALPLWLGASAALYLALGPPPRRTGYG